MIEVKNLRTRHSKTFDDGSGTLQISYSSTPLHYYENGEWKDIHLKIREGKLLHNAIKADFTGEDFPVKFTSKKREIGFKALSMRYSNSNGETELIGESNFGELDFDGNAVTFKNLLPYTDDEFIIYQNSVKDNMYLNQKPPVPNLEGEVFLEYVDQLSGSHNTYLEVDGEKVTEVTKTNGKIKVRDNYGRLIFTMPELLTFEKDNPNVSVIGEYEIIPEEKGYKLISRIPYKWVADTNRNYPIVIDPNTTIEPLTESSGMTYVDEANPTANYSLYDDLIVGLDSDGFSKEVLLKFDPLPTKHDYSKVELRLVDGGTDSLLVKEILADWDEGSVTWNNKPNASGTVQEVTSTIDITEMAKRWRDGYNYGLMITHNFATAKTRNLFVNSGKVEPVIVSDVDYTGRIYVDPQLGSDSTGDGSKSNPYSTLEHVMINIDTNYKEVYLVDSGKHFLPNMYRFHENYTNHTAIIGEPSTIVPQGHMNVTNGLDHVEFFNVIIEIPESFPSSTYMWSIYGSPQMYFKFHNCVFSDKHDRLTDQFLRWSNSSSYDPQFHLGWSQFNNCSIVAAKDDPAYPVLLWAYYNETSENVEMNDCDTNRNRLVGSVTYPIISNPSYNDEYDIEYRNLTGDSGTGVYGGKYSWSSGIKQPELFISFEGDNEMLPPKYTYPRENTLNWTEYVPDGISKNFISYEVMRGSTASFSYSNGELLATITDPTVTEYVDRELTPGETYYYKVFLNKTSGEYSSWVDKTVEIDPPKDMYAIGYNPMDDLWYGIDGTSTYYFESTDEKFRPVKATTKHDAIAMGDARQVKELILDGSSQLDAIVHSEDFIFVGSHDHYVYVLSKPDMDRVGKINFGADVYGMQLMDGFLIVGGGSGQCKIYDAATFQYVGITLDAQLGYTYDFDYDDNYLYLANNNPEQFIFNRNNFSLSHTLTIPNSYNGRAVITDDNNIYYGDSGGIVTVFDKASGNVLTELTCVGQVYYLLIDSGKLYASTRSGYSYVYDINNNFNLLHEIQNDANYIFQTDIDDKYFYEVHNNNTKVYVMDKTSMVRVYEFDGHTDGHGIAADSVNGLLYVSRANSTFEAYSLTEFDDIDQPKEYINLYQEDIEPAEYAELPVGRYAIDIDSSNGEVTVVTGYGDIYVYNHGTFTKKVEYALPSATMAHIDEKFIYISAGSNLKVYSRFNYSEVLSVDKYGTIYDIDSDEDNFYFGGNWSSRTWVFDKTTLIEKVRLDERTGGDVKAYTNDVDNLFVGGNGNILTVYAKDFAGNVTFDQEYTLAEVPNIQSLECDDQFLYVGASDGQLYIYDKLTLTYKITVEFDYTNGFQPNNLKVHNNKIFACNKTGQLKVLEYSLELDDFVQVKELWTRTERWDTYAIEADDSFIYSGPHPYVSVWGMDYYAPLEGKFSEGILTCGKLDNKVVNSTWKYDSSLKQWKKLAPTNPPTARHSFGFGGNLIFGGVDKNGNLLNDTWKYSGGNWFQLSTSEVPPVRKNPAMTRGEDGNIYMYGGENKFGTLDDFWRFDPSKDVWTEIKSAKTKIKVNAGNHYTTSISGQEQSFAHDNDTIYSATTASRVYKIDKESGKIYGNIPCGVGSIYDIEVNDQHIYIGGADLHVFDKETETLLQSVTIPGNVNAVAEDNNYIYCGSSDYKVYIVDKADYSVLVDNLADATNAITSMTLQGSYLFVASKDGTLRVYNTFSGMSQVAALTQATAGIVEVFADSDNVFTFSKDGKVRIYNRADFSFINSITTGTTTGAYSLAVDNNNIMVGGTHDKVEVFNRKTLEKKYELGYNNPYAIFSDKESKFFYVGYSSENHATVRDESYGLTEATLTPDLSLSFGRTVAGTNQNITYKFDGSDLVKRLYSTRPAVRNSAFGMLVDGNIYAYGGEPDYSDMWRLDYTQPIQENSNEIEVVNTNFGFGIFRNSGPNKGNHFDNVIDKTQPDTTLDTIDAKISDDQRYLFHFGLEDFPESVIIDNGKLKLNGLSVSGSTQLEAHLCTTDWDSTVTWNNQPMYNSATTSVIDVDSTTTELIFDLGVDLNTAYGVIIKKVDETDGVVVTANSIEDDKNRPEFEVTFLTRGLAFDNSVIDYDFYTSPEGIKIKPLEMGTVLSEQSKIVSVELINANALTAQEVTLEFTGLDTGDLAELSLSNDPFTAEAMPYVYGTLQPGEKKVLYVKITPAADSTGVKNFNLNVSSKIV